MEEKTIRLEPIGTIHTDHETPENMPIQGSMDPEARGTVSIDSEYTGGLKDLEKFSHLILIYTFHESDDHFDLNVEPFLEDQSHGVFATRAPRRPNPIGLTTVQLDSVHDGGLSVRGIDVLDGTPLLDIKPYIPDVDAYPEADDGWIEGRMTCRHESDDRFVH
jgi:tRNA-Thr(GGU) m(6)t(6)A37 methyltransferase TsaA